MRSVSIALALVALLVLVALGSAGGEWGGGVEAREVPRAFVDAAYTVGILVLLGLAALVIWALTGPSAGARIERPRGLSQLGFALFALVLLSWYAFSERYPRGEGEGEGEGARPPGALPDSPEGFADAPGPRFQWWIALGAVAALVALAYYERRRRARRAAAPTAAQELESVLTLTLEELEGELDADPRRAVIQAYARMEQVLDAHGHGRLPHEAPLEYLARILRELEVRPAAAHALTELFERAKFSRHDIDAAMRAEAVASLEAVRDDLRAAA